MSILTRIASGFENMFRKTRNERELDAEVRSYVQLLAEENMRSGMSTEKALRAARVELGGIEQVKEQSREARAGASVDSLLQDLQYGARMLRKNPGFSVIAILTLALGIGASTAVFSLVNAVLLKPLPYPNSQQIVFPWRQPPAGLNVGYNEMPWGRPDFLFFARECESFQSVGAFKSDSFNLTGAGDATRLDGLRASAGFFPSLGISPFMGRTFTAEEDQIGHEHEVVLSYSLWRDRFGSETQILGRVLHLNSESYTVIGVMPQGFVFPRAEEMPNGFPFPRATQLWVPLALVPGPIIPGEDSELAVIGRLQPGITPAQAQSEMKVMSKRLEDFFPGGKGWFGTKVTSLQGQIAGDMRRPLLLILGAVGVVLLIACSNVAGLLLSRSLARTKEFTLRAALGAGKWRLMRQLLTEALILATIGGIAGILIAKVAVHFVKFFAPTNIPRLSEVSLDIRVVLFALAITFVTGILFGLAPAIAGSRDNLAESLKEGGQRSGSSPVGAKLRNLLLISEVAFALVLVISAGLLTRTFLRLLSVDPGFNPTRALTFELTLPATKYTDQPEIVALYQRALQSIRSLPGVDSAGITATTPLGGATESTSIRLPDHPSQDPKARAFSNYTMISPGYFAAAGTPLLRGRDFLESDTADALPVTIINSAMAKKFWPGQDAIGQQVAPASKKYPAATIVGIVADVKRLSLREDPAPEMYVPYNQKVWPSLLTMDVILRTKVDPASLTDDVRNALRSVDPDLPLAKIATLSTIVDDSMTLPRFAMLVLGSFAGVALLLASVGLYGVISYFVGQRTREIGVRVALGARPRDVFGMVLGQGARLAAIGIALGLLAALAATRMMVSFLYRVQPIDPLTFAALPFVLLFIALLACYVPARRAMRVDPLVALRHE
jgi:putative ABC transport system permease protein